MPRKILSINKLDGHFYEKWRHCEVKNVIKDYSKKDDADPRYPIGFIGCVCDVLDHKERWHNDVSFYCVKLSK